MPKDDPVEESRKLLDEMDVLLQRIRARFPPSVKPSFPKPTLVQPDPDDKK